MKAFVVPGYLLVVLAVACARGPAHDVLYPGKASGGLSGVVLVGPTCPVERAGSPCPDRPVARATVIARDTRDRVVATTTSAADGRYTLHLSQGVYSIVVESGSVGMRAATVTAVVPPSEVPVRLDLHIDSGIR